MSDSLSHLSTDILVSAESALGPVVDVLVWMRDIQEAQTADEVKALLGQLGVHRMALIVARTDLYKIGAFAARQRWRRC